MIAFLWGGQGRQGLAYLRSIGSPVSGCLPALSLLSLAAAALWVFTCGLVQGPFNPTPSLSLAKRAHLVQYAIGPISTTAWPAPLPSLSSLAVP